MTATNRSSGANWWAISPRRRTTSTAGPPPTGVSRNTWSDSATGAFPVRNFPAPADRLRRVSAMYLPAGLSRACPGQTFRRRVCGGPSGRPVAGSNRATRKRKSLSIVHSTRTASASTVDRTSPYPRRKEQSGGSGTRNFGTPVVESRASRASWSSPEATAYSVRPSRDTTAGPPMTRPSRNRADPSRQTASAGSGTPSASSRGGVVGTSSGNMSATSGGTGGSSGRGRPY